jgi:hypothetical protein
MSVENHMKNLVNDIEDRVDRILDHGIDPDFYDDFYRLTGQLKTVIEKSK